MTRPNVNWAQGWPGEDTAADLGEGGIQATSRFSRPRYFTFSPHL